MKIAKLRKWPLLFIPVAAAAVFFIFFRMYQVDIKALRDFVASYESFDKASSYYTDKARTKDALDYAGEAGTELQVRASLRLSSLIRNDAELMVQAREIADVSRKELHSLRAYDALTKNRNPNRDEVAKEEELGRAIGGLRGKRKAAYARFEELAGIR
jgi:hypothetical protein